jgi:hypothetical protein
MLTIGTTVIYNCDYWTVQAVGWVGERYYWLTCDDCPREIAMLPASIVERLPSLFAHKSVKGSVNS